MKHVVSFSGGRTSAYLVHLIEQKRINDGWDVEYVFMDTGSEADGTYDFIKQVASNFNINLRCIKASVSQEYGESPSYIETDINSIGWDLKPFADISKKYGAPFNPGGMHCTQHLKTIPYKKYCNDKFGKGKYITWCGIRVDEKSRLKPKKGYRYLAEISPMTKGDIIGWWREQDFDLQIDEWEGNCVFCPKKPVSHVALATLSQPEKANQFGDCIVSNDKNGELRGAIYRGKLTLSSIGNLYHGYDKDRILSTTRLRRGCAVEQGESCEVFGCQMDMFD